MTHLPDKPSRVPGSFRDPSGFVFLGDGRLYRQINRQYQEPYDRLMRSGLYDALTRDGLLIPHEEVGVAYALTGEAAQVIRPELVPFISYPYEWCFTELKQAALVMLQIQKRAVECGMSLKDGSAYNIQFRDAKPILIDTLSFEKYREGLPWVAYRQFCQHFLAPLALMSYVDVRLHQLLAAYLDGIPLDLAGSLLPLRTRANFGLLSHVHLHAGAQKHYEGRSLPGNRAGMGRTAFLGLVDSLETTIKHLRWNPKGTQWGDYESICNYSPAAVEHKKRCVAEMLDKIDPAPRTIWDCGANTGSYSRIASERGILTIAFDKDPAAVEKNYLAIREKNETGLLPLVLDLTNPSPGRGWENQERMSLVERGPADLVFALALVHHLAIGNNLPFRKIANQFSRMGRALIIEFVPKGDPQVQKLLSSREDIFPDYTQDAFEREFSEFFAIRQREKIADTERILFQMVRADA